MRQQFWSVLFPVVGVAVLLLGVHRLAESMDASSALLFLGKLHPLVLHLPIGALTVAVLLDVLFRRKTGTEVLSFVWLFGSAGAVAAAATGLLLSSSGGYPEDTLEWHERLGILTALAATLFYRLRQFPSLGTDSRRIWVHRLSGSFILIVLLLGGHLGGKLTHGEEYLTEHLPDAIRGWWAGEASSSVPRIEDPATAGVFSDLIQPILERRCVSCHGPSKRRGDLRLDSAEGLRKGGAGGEIFAARRPAQSELVRRIWLPPEHKAHMPPRESPQLSVSEAEVIRWWIQTGAEFEMAVSRAEITPEVRIILEEVGLRQTSGVFALKIPPAEDSLLEQVRDAGVVVRPIAEAQPFLQVHCGGAGRKFDDVQFEKLTPLARQVTWLDVGGTSITDNSLALLAGFEHLNRLHLEKTLISDAGLKYLSDLSHLEYLNLYGTSITDAGLSHLMDLPNLKTLYLWQTQVTPAGVEELKSAVPNVEIVMGS